MLYTISTFFLPSLISWSSVVVILILTQLFQHSYEFVENRYIHGCINVIDITIFTATLIFQLTHWMLSNNFFLFFLLLLLLFF